MATTVSFNGATYQIPATGNQNYGAYTSAYLIAVAAGAPGKAIANTFSARQTFSAGIGLGPQAQPAQVASAQAYNATGTGDVYVLSPSGYSATPYKLTQPWLQPVATKAVVIGPVSGPDAYATARLLVAGDIPDIAESQVTGLVAALAAKADDSLVVHLAGTESITGAKTFSLAPTFTLGATYGAAQALTWSTRAKISSPADGVVLLTDNAAAAFTSLRFGGSTASFPAIKRNATAINFRLADDSADAPITSAAATLSGALTLPAGSFTTPSINFGTAGTGIYGGGAVINFAAASAIQFQMSATQLTATPGGTNSAPLYCFAGSATTGFFNTGSGASAVISTSINGTERGSIGPGTSGNPAQTLFGGVNGSNLIHQCTSTGPTTVTAASTTVAVIPAGSLVLAVAARVTTTISGGSVTSWQLGDAGVGTTQYGTLLALPSGTTTTLANTTLTSPKFYAASTNLTFTPVGGTPAAGAVRVDVYYIKITAPTS